MYPQGNNCNLHFVPAYGHIYVNACFTILLKNSSAGDKLTLTPRNYIASSYNSRVSSLTLNGTFLSNLANAFSLLCSDLLKGSNTLLDCLVLWFLKTDTSKCGQNNPDSTNSTKAVSSWEMTPLEDGPINADTEQITTAINSKLIFT